MIYRINYCAQTLNVSFIAEQAGQASKLAAFLATKFGGLDMLN